MILSSLFLSAWEILLRSRVIWFFIGITFIFQLLGYLIPVGALYPLGAVLLAVSWLAGIYGLAGLIYSTVRQWKTRPVSVGEAHRAVINQFLPLVLLYIAPLLVHLLLTRFLIVLVQTLAPSDVSFQLLSIALSIFILMIVTIGWLLFHYCSLLWQLSC
jgi:hypothetical protein